jgi:HCOMODA/2-hydroxy-3-carboxy-muconic semialdehyde decarboxylase
MSEQRHSPAGIEEAIRELVTANRILGHEGVMDALGHVSLRHPLDANRYLLACSRSPALVTEDDILEFALDSTPLVDPGGRSLYAERAIHGCIYRARPDVQAVCHSHAHPLIPFVVTGVPLQPIWVMGAPLGNEVPLWDIREDFPNEDGMLVVNETIGASLVKRLGGGRACLLAGHGAVVAEADLRRTVLTAISLVTNAELLLQARLLTLTHTSPGGQDMRYLTPGEIAAMTALVFSPSPLERLWEYWATRAGRGEPTD